jgi:hypothetical protein
MSFALGVCRSVWRVLHENMQVGSALPCGAGRSEGRRATILSAFRDDFFLARSFPKIDDLEQPRKKTALRRSFWIE